MKYYFDTSIHVTQNAVTVMIVCLLMAYGLQIIKFMQMHRKLLEHCAEIKVDKYFFISLEVPVQNTKLQ